MPASSSVTSANSEDDPATFRRDVTVRLESRSYGIAIGPDQLSQTAGWLAAATGKDQPGVALVVTDSNLTETHAKTVAESLRRAGWKIAVHVIPAGEASKNLQVIAGMYDRLVDLQADRKSLVIAVGGGVVGDAAGFAAATYNRGLPFIQIPTTLLAMVDSSVGGKVGINHPRGKNLIGAFHQPQGVLIDPDTLGTLPPRDFHSGLAEVVKYGVILDAEFFARLEQQAEAILRREPGILAEVIQRSCQLKADVVEQDEYERTGLRAVLNYGHTFGHAYEALAGYGELTHGEAIAIGMMHAAVLAERRGLIGQDLVDRQRVLLATFRLPVKLPGSARFGSEEILSRMRLDKKNANGKVRLILPTRLGEVKLFADVPDAEIIAAIEAAEA